MIWARKGLREKPEQQGKGAIVARKVLKACQEAWDLKAPKASPAQMVFKALQANLALRDLRGQWEL